MNTIKKIPEGQSVFENGDSAAFWAGLADGKLLFQKCKACGAIQHPPRHLCGECWSEDIGMMESSGEGVLESHTVVRRAPLPEFRDEVPYVIGAVRLAEGPRMITTIVGKDAMAARIGDGVKLEIARDARGNLLPRFTV